MNLCFKLNDLRLISHVKNIQIDEELYTANPSLEVVYSEQSNNFEKEKSFLKVSYINLDLRLAQGKRVEIFYFNFALQKKWQVRKMIITKVSKTEDSFFLELSSLSDIFGIKKMNYFSETCRASFSDKACKIDASKFAFEGFISGFSKDFLEIYDEKLKAESYDDFKLGKMIITDFPEEEMLVFKVENQRIVLLFESHVPLKIGMKYKIFMGCDKSLKTCINKYKNAVNFRGEPFIFEKFPSSGF